MVRSAEECNPNLFSHIHTLVTKFKFILNLNYQLLNKGKRGKKIEIEKLVII